MTINSTAAQTIAISVSAAANTPIAADPISVVATSGSLSHTTGFAADVTPASPWQIQASPSSVSLTPGTSATVTLSLTSSAPTSPQISVTAPVTEQPPFTGIDITTSQGFLTTTTPATVTINPTAQAVPLNNVTLPIVGTDSSTGNTVQINLPLTVTVPYGANTTPTRSTYVRTDQPPSAFAYDQQRKLLFVAVEVLNEIVVLSTIDGHRVATIPTAYPVDVDETADGKTVYVVSEFVHGITQIDPSTLQVTAHIAGPTTVGGQAFDPYFFQLATLSTGQVMLTSAITSSSLPTALIWTPSTGEFSSFSPAVFSQVNIIERSWDHTKVLGTSASGGALYDAATGTVTGPNPQITTSSTISPDGSQILSVGLQNDTTNFFDSSLKLIKEVPVSIFPFRTAVYSADGTTAYAFAEQNSGVTGDVATVINTTTFQVEGLIPGFIYETGIPFSGQSFPNYVLDETGMMYGGANRGVAFLDVTAPTSLSLPLPQFFNAQPTLMNENSPTTAQLNGVTFSSALNPKVYVGAPPASPNTLVASNVSVASTNILSLTIPAAASPGPANVTYMQSDGFFEVMPDAVTFGPYILNINSNAGSPAGGDSITITGYGFDAGNPTVTIGGKPASITSTRTIISEQQFPTETMVVTTSPGIPGLADVVVTTASGSATSKGGFQYVESAQTYIRAAALDDVIYDQPRQRLYLSNESTNTVDVFNLATNSFTTAIPVGNNPSSMALMPDGTILAVLNSADNTVSLVDPVGLKMTTSYTALTAGDSGCEPQAFGLAAAEPHRVVYDVLCGDTELGGNFHILNLDTGILSCTGIAGCGPDGTSIAYTVGVGEVASSNDGSKVFFVRNNSTGSGYPSQLLDLTANKKYPGFSGSFGDVAASADGFTFAESTYFLNNQGENFGVEAFEPFVPTSGEALTNVIGEKLSYTGSLFFQPQASDVQIFDTHSGRLVLQFSVADGVPLDSGALAVDETGSKIFVITSSGLTIYQLAQVPLSIGYLTPASGSDGTTLKIRGTGFVTGATVSFGTTEATTTFVDASTLQVTVPSLAAGNYRVTITNPNGQIYSLDDAFTAN